MTVGYEFREIDLKILVGIICVSRKHQIFENFRYFVCLFMHVRYRSGLGFATSIVSRYHIIDHRRGRMLKFVSKNSVNAQISRRREAFLLENLYGTRSYEISFARSCAFRKCTRSIVAFVLAKLLKPVPFPDIL